MAGLGSELARKAVHISMGGFAFALRWLTPWQAVLCAVVALLFNLFVLHRLTRRSLLREGERDRETRDHDENDQRSGPGGEGEGLDTHARGLYQTHAPHAIAHQRSRNATPPSFA